MLLQNRGLLWVCQNFSQKILAKKFSQKISQKISQKSHKNTNTFYIYYLLWVVHNDRDDYDKTAVLSGHYNLLVIMQPHSH